MKCSCGNDKFEIAKWSKTYILVNGDGEEIEEFDNIADVKFEGPYECSQCKKKYKGLV